MNVVPRLSLNPLLGTVGEVNSTLYDLAIIMFNSLVIQLSHLE